MSDDFIKCLKKSEQAVQKYCWTIENSLVSKEKWSARRKIKWVGFSNEEINLIK